MFIEMKISNITKKWAMYNLSLFPNTMFSVKGLKSVMQ